MIFVDIYVPALNEQYEFKVDENVYIADVVKEMGEILVAGQTQNTENDNEKIEDMLLCDDSRQQVFPLNQSLKQNGVGNGSRLFLI